MLKVDIKFIKEVFGDISKVTSDFCTPFKTCRIYSNDTKLLIVSTHSNDFCDKPVQKFVKEFDMTVEYIHKKNHLLTVLTIKDKNTNI